MWILFDELKEHGARASIQDGLREITSVRLFSFDEPLSIEYIYITHASDFYDSERDQILLMHGRDTIFVDGLDLIQALNHVLLIFDKYNDWDSRLRKACLETNHFQAILDIAHDMFLCPMFFGHKNLRIYAITRQYPEDEVYVGWDEVKDLNTMPASLIKKKIYPNMKKYPETIDPVAIPTSAFERKCFNYQIRANCYLNGNVWGHFYLYYKEPSVSCGVMQLARHVADIYGEILEKTHNKNMERYTMHSFLMDMLDGKEIPDVALLNHYWQKGWDESSELMLFRFTPMSMSNDELLFDWMCNNIAEKAANSIVFPYKNSILIIIRECESSVILPHIESLLSISSYHCGASFPFTGLENIAYYYFQAGYAIECSANPENRLHYFKDYAFAGYAQFIKTHTKWRNFIVPSLFKLIETDRQQDSEYYKTLYCLIVNQGRFNKTSAQLYIHRNTLKYRIEKITQILEMDIFEESVCAYLRFCFALMMEDFPVLLPSPPAQD